MAKTESEEVSLLDLLAGFLAAMKKNLVLSILLPVAGTLIALAVSFNTRNLFESALLIETSLLSENECQFLFDQMNKAGTIPGLSPEERKMLAGFSFKVFKNGSEADLNEKSLFLEVTARVFNKEIFPELEKSLVKMVNENPSVIRHRDEREKFYGEMIERIEAEIQSMEAVKNQISGNIQATYLNPAELYSNSVSLHRERIQYEIRREQIRSVHLIKGFDSLTVNARPNRLLAAVLGFAIGFAILCVILFVRFFSHYLSVYETTH